MKKKLIGLVIALIILSCTTISCKKESKVYFNGKVMDVSKYTVLDEVLADINNHGTEDKITMYGEKFEIWEFTKVIVITDGKTNEVLTSLDGDKRVLEIADLNQDGVKDIVLGESAGNFGYMENVFLYKDGEYLANDFSKVTSLKVELLEDFYIEITDQDSLKSYTKLLPKEIYERYLTDYNNQPLYYNVDGSLTLRSRSEFGSETGYKDEIRDVDGDGNVEYLDKVIVIGNFQADGILVNTKVYKFVNDKFELIDMYGDFLE